MFRLFGNLFGASPRGRTLSGCVGVITLATSCLYLLGIGSYFMRPRLFAAPLGLTTVISRPTLLPTPTQQPVPTLQLQARTLVPTPTQAPIPTRAPITPTPIISLTIIAETPVHGAIETTPVETIEPTATTIFITTDTPRPTNTRRPTRTPPPPTNTPSAPTHPPTRTPRPTRTPKS